MQKKRIFLLLILSYLFTQSCNKISNENINSFMYHLKGDIYLDHTTRSILVKKKNNENSFILGKTIVDKIDSIYISNDKNVIYIINDENEVIHVKPDFKIEKLNKRHNVNFNSILSYHD